MALITFAGAAMACGIGEVVEPAAVRMGSDCENACDACSASCSPTPPGWDGPVLLWYGDALDQPECPEGAPPVYEGFADPGDAFACPACTCSASACVLPSGITAISTSCYTLPPVPGTIFADLNAPEGWDGTCVSSFIPDDTMQSMIFYGPTETGCEPVVGPAPDAPRPWRVHALACGGITEAHCSESDEPCDGSRGAFSACIHRAGEEPTCPVGYSRREVFYDALDDMRACTPCACGEPEESDCRVLWKWYEDDECTNVDGAGIDKPGGVGCEDFGSPDVTLASMDAMFLPEAHPGTCAPSGGEPVGEAVPKEPTTFCCEDPPASADGSAM